MVNRKTMPGYRLSSYLSQSVVPGNHDVKSALADGHSIALADFPTITASLAMTTEQLYYTCEVLPKVQLIGLNSNFFDEQGQQVGRLDNTQLEWLGDLAKVQDELVLDMVHHNVVEHLPSIAP